MQNFDPLDRANREEVNVDILIAARGQNRSISHAPTVQEDQGLRVTKHDHRAATRRAGGDVGIGRTQITATGELRSSFTQNFHDVGGNAGVLDGFGIENRHGNSRGNARHWDVRSGDNELFELNGVIGAGCRLSGSLRKSGISREQGKPDAEQRQRLPEVIYEAMVHSSRLVVLGRKLSVRLISKVLTCHI